MTACVVFTANINGVDLDVVQTEGKRWLTARDLAAVLGYKCESGVRIAYSRHRKVERLQGHSIKAKIAGYVGSDARIFDEVAVSYFCENSKRPGAFHILRWLDAGGMQMNATTAAESAPVAANVLAFKSPSTTPPASQDERQKAYCRELMKTLLRYSTALEAEDLTHIIEAEVVNLIGRRHCPGLNDARYEVYRRYWLQGGDV
ncbi:hypothetical protein ACTXN4_28115 [Pseudomonas helleri]|uniref:hypothetical protein n=1 Tax=Pseudomonas helleri TaxID=1608996 RepID=UPI003FD5188D